MRTVILIVVLSVGLFLNSFAQGISKDRFESNRLFELYQNLPQTLQAEINIEISGELLYSKWSLPLYFSTNKAKKINHIGFKLPISNQQQDKNTVEQLFLERYLLELVLWQDDTLATNRMIADKITLKRNGNLWNENGFNTLNQIHPILAAGVELSLHCKTDTCMAILTHSDKKEQLEVMFRKNRQLLTGKDKIEYGIEVASDLQRLNIKKEVSVLQIDTNSLQKEEDYWFKSSNSFYIIENLHQNMSLFYNDGNIELINAKEFPCESITNILLFSNYIETEPQLHIEHRIYGNDIVKNYSTNFASFQHYFSDFAFYAGCEEKIDIYNYATLLMHNEELNFVNVVYVESDERTLFTESPMFKVRLYTGIPMDNIKNLYKKLYD